MRDYEHVPPGRQRGPVQERYQTLSISRQPFLDEARKCAALTIPSLCPPEGLSNGTKLLEPSQPYGALGVKNLAEKICRALFPPGRSFFRLSISQLELERQVTEMVARIVQNQPGADPQAVQQLIADMTRDANTELEHKLAVVEQAILRDFELDSNRPTDSEGLKHLINDGAVAIGVKVDSLLKSEQEVEAAREQQMQMQLAQQAVGPAINAAAQGAQQEAQPPM